MKKINWRPLLICLAVPLAVGGLSALLTKDGMERFSESVTHPPLTPPNWLFPVVWTILFLLMGVASYLVYTSGAPRKDVRTALWVYAFQLLVNLIWTISFFNFQTYLFAFFWLVFLWLLILASTVLFFRISKPAGYLLLPYLAWVAFAGYLNMGIYLLNR